MCFTLLFELLLVVFTVLLRACILLKDLGEEGCSGSKVRSIENAQQMSAQSPRKICSH